MRKGQVGTSRPSAAEGSVRIGVVGAGAFGRRHLDYLSRNPYCEIAGIADPAPAAAALAAERGLAYYADVEALLDGARPDGVVIATPNALHVPVGLACAARRVPMLVEKPIAESLAGARSLSGAAARTSTPILVGHHRRHNPVLERAREIVQGGAIGRLAAVTALLLLRKPDDYFDVPWRRVAGGGPVLINLIHDVDDLRFVAGEIVAVQAFTANAVRGFAVEDTVAVALRFAGGALGTITVSDAVPAPWSWELTAGENPLYPQQPENCYLFCGTAGSLAVPRLELWRYPGAARWDAPLARAVLAVSGADPLARQLEHFRRVIRREEAPRVTAEDAARTLEATLAVHAAAALGGTVAVGLDSGFPGT